MTEKPKTRAQLEEKIAALEAAVLERGVICDRQRNQIDEARSAEKQTRAQFDDLKQRLATSEADNQRMRGYIARVQEDDVVREELVMTGDAGGEQRLVPKRKPTLFGEPYPYMVDNSRGMAVSGYDHNGARPPSKHWVTY